MTDKTNMTLEQAMDAYSAHFGNNYPLCFGKHHGTGKELIDKILSHIENNTPAPEPDYEDGREY